MPILWSYINAKWLLQQPERGEIYYIFICPKKNSNIVPIQTILSLYKFVKNINSKCHQIHHRIYFNLYIFKVININIFSINLV
jgi:hypothetical protein